MEFKNKILAAQAALTFVRQLMENEAGWTVDTFDVTYADKRIAVDFKASLGGNGGWAGTKAAPEEDDEL